MQKIAYFWLSGCLIRTSYLNPRAASKTRSKKPFHYRPTMLTSATTRFRHAPHKRNTNSLTALSTCVTTKQNKLNALHALIPFIQTQMPLIDNLYTCRSHNELHLAAETDPLAIGPLCLISFDL